MFFFLRSTVPNHATCCGIPVLLRQVLLTVPPTKSSMTFDIFYTIFKCFVCFFNSKSHLVCLHPKFTHTSYRSESSSNKICRKQVSVKHKQENEIFLQFLKWIRGVLLSENSFCKKKCAGISEVWTAGDSLAAWSRCLATSPAVWDFNISSCSYKKSLLASTPPFRLETRGNQTPCCINTPTSGYPTWLSHTSCSNS